MPINEALLSFLTPDQKFKIDSDRPNAAIGEIAAFHFVIKMETEDDNAARQTAANQIAQNPDIQKLMAAGGVFFLDITKDRERKLTGQHIFKGVLSVRDSKANDVSKLKPILTSTDGKLKLYNMAEAGQKSASAEDVTIGSSGTSGSAGSSGSSGTGGGTSRPTAARQRPGARGSCRGPPAPPPASRCSTGRRPLRRPGPPPTT